VADTGSPHVLIAKRELKVQKNKGKGTFKYKKGVDIKKKRKIKDFICLSIYSIS
jgi:hypothetical protein